MLKQVAIMQKELEDLQPQLIVTQEENRKLLIVNYQWFYLCFIYQFKLFQVIEKETVEVADKTKTVKADEEVANSQAADSKVLKEECESDLAEALPALEAAMAALKTLKVKLKF